MTADLFTSLTRRQRTALTLKLLRGQRDLCRLASFIDGQYGLDDGGVWVSVFRTARELGELADELVTA